MFKRIDDEHIEITGTANISIGRWKKGKARPRRFIRCAVSGRAVVKGDLVYRPLEFFNGPKGQRILAEEADRAVERDRGLYRGAA